MERKKSLIDEEANEYPTKIFKAGLIIFSDSPSNQWSTCRNYPFQNPGLSDDARLDNLISLMTLDEKIDHLFPTLPGIPRLGVKGTRTVEGLHGLAWSGPANWGC